MELSRRVAYLSIASLVVIVGFELWVFSLERSRRTKIIRVHMIVILELITFLMVRYIWRRMAHLVKFGGLFSVGALLKVVLLVVLMLAHFSWFSGYLLVGTDPHVVSAVSAACFGTVIFLTTALVITDICSFIVRRILCRGCGEGRRTTDFTEIKIRTLLALFCAIILIYGGLVGVSQLAIERVSVPIKGLSPRLNGTTVVQLSDIHLGPFSGRTRLSRIVEKVNQLDGDIVVITGDLVDAPVAVLKEAVSPLANLRSKHGVFYTTGNHEYYTGDVENWVRELPRLNVTPLIDRRVCLLGEKGMGPAGDCQGGLYLAGLEDISSRGIYFDPSRMNLGSALSGRQEGVPTVVLAHQPWAAVEAIMWKDVRLVLSGHTHAGQIFPLAPAVYLYNPFFVGLYQPRPEVYVYVSPGTLYYMVPFRHYRPEITYFTLLSS